MRMLQENSIKGGSIVFHEPTGEKWLVLGKRNSEVCIDGYPPTIAQLSDCVFQQQYDLTQQEISYRNKQFGSDWV